ncbi:MAG: hypothetical protein Q8Q85_03150 [Gemmatimonadales bacterium]|nr:hypothetical protein [Gemmatimonadales bacterium]
MAGTSGLVLFLELAFIRYVAAEVKFFSYYTNFVILGAFLGSGIGLLAWRRLRHLASAWPAFAVALFAAVSLLRDVTVKVPRGEFLWGIYGQPSPTAVALGLAPTVLLVFTVLAAVFVPLGARLGRLFGEFRPLTAYSLDIGGALTGVAVFALMSRVSLPPVVWFGAAFAAEFLLGGSGWRGRLGALAAAGFGLGVVLAGARPDERWSPYYRIDVYPGPEPGYEIVNVNGSLHQFIVDFADSSRSPTVRRVLHDYRLPYDFVERLDTVLVVGAGTGNDIALLLAMGAKAIDAVEIDPAILTLGRARHRASPYADPRVRVFVDDARAFLRKTRRHYSLIVFGTLDSQTLLSGLSSLRLDNYVYTMEAMQDARARLEPGGRLIMYQMAGFRYIAARVYQNLYWAFGAPALAIRIEPPVLFNTVFVGGMPREHIADYRVPSWLLGETRLPTDNWPYLYLRHPSVPGHYLWALGGVLALALVGVAGAVGGWRGAGSFDATMFCFGAGFLLLETKSVTEMALLFGSTWTVNVLVFASILSVVLAANVAVARGFRPQPRVLFAGLLAALALGAVLPVRSLAGLGLVAQWTLGSLVVALPILFAALLFPRFFALRPDPARALGWNVLGAIVGGVLEYGSMVAGIKVLYLLAALTYALAIVASRREGGRAAVAA